MLIEPALYDIARGDAAVEQHVAAVEHARDAPTTFEFWRRFRPIMFGGPASEDDWERERPVAERVATTMLPWGHGVRAEAIADVPTLVVTGGWNDEYEAVADRLAAVGAEHQHLRGHEHRPQDHADFGAVTGRFLAAHGLTSP